jgi:glycosyltransferase involved in cell wall biosynthesis
MGNPRLTVLMPVYNAEKFLRKAIDSVLRQTFMDFNFIIFNDGSTDNSEKIIRQYSNSDNRIKYFSSKRNRGYVYFLNKGLKSADTEYIARMDGDDISLPRRFEKQIAFMEKHKEIGICGTFLKTFGYKRSVWSLPKFHDDILAGMLFESMLHHPTVIIRSKIISDFNKFYKAEFMPAEDYEYWVRLGLLGVKFANIGEVLYRYRQHGKNVGRIYNVAQKRNSEKVRMMLLNNLDIQPSEEEFLIHNILANGYSADKGYIEKAYLWLDKIKKINEEKKIYTESSLEKEIGRRWFKLCYNSASLGLKIWDIYHKSVFFKVNRLSMKEKIKFFTKSFLKIDRKRDLLYKYFRKSKK